LEAENLRSQLIKKTLHILLFHGGEGVIVEACPQDVLALDAFFLRTELLTTFHVSILILSSPLLRYTVYRSDDITAYRGERTERSEESGGGVANQSLTVCAESRVDSHGDPFRHPYDRLILAHWYLLSPTQHHNASFNSTLPSELTHSQSKVLS
jgi:hypothetical protein